MVELLVSGIVLLVLLLAALVFFAQRKKLERRGEETLKLAQAEGQMIPLSLHPVIDPVLCVGSFSCIKACPEGEIIGIVDGVATLVEAAHCIGHGTCADECPVGAIKLVFGTAERGVDLPEADERFESSRPGVFIVGELGGMGLIKNALRQGLLVGRSIKDRIKKAPEAPGVEVTDVVIVGGGPAGIASAISCREQGLSVRVFEQESLGGAIAHYPRGKVVMTEQIEMPRYGRFGKALLSKEELMAELNRLVHKNQVVIEEGQKVERIDGDAPFFSVTTGKGEKVQCRAVVLATGLRGSPRKLGAPGEDLPKVTYRLVDPEQYHGRAVLVVGGGDSAVEAAIQLAEESTAKVAISYRGKSFTRCKPRNRDKITKLIENGNIQAFMESQVLHIDKGVVTLGPASDDKDGGKAPAQSAAQQAPHVQVGLQVPVAQAAGPGALPSMAGVGPTEIAADTNRMRRPMVSVVSSLRVRALSEQSEQPEQATAPFQDTGRRAQPQMSREQAPYELESETRITRNLTVKGRVRALDALQDDTALRKAKAEAGIARAPTPAAHGGAPAGSRLRNDDIIVSIGGELPSAFLNAIQVGTRRYHGEEKAAGKGTARGPSKAEVEARSRRRLALTLFTLGGAIIAGLLLIGREYYWLPLEDRHNSPLHPLLRPSGLWGHGVGVVATMFMLANFIYAARKRWRFLKGRASIRTWLTFHMFVGLMSPLVIAFHSAFLANNLLAVWTWLALTIVVGTGVFGRFLFGLVPTQTGKMISVSELREKVSDINAVLQPRIRDTTNVLQVTQIFDLANTMHKEKTVVGVFLDEAGGQRQLKDGIEEARKYFKDEGAYAFFKDSILQLARARMQISFYATLKRIFRGWLVVHVVLAAFMVVLIGAHVAVTTYLGFGAFFVEPP